MTTASPPLVITIDGPAGTGKSSVAHMLALRLGLEFLDTGAMYRAAALLAIELAIPIDDGEAIAQALSETDLVFDWKTSPPRLLLGGRNVSQLIRSHEVTEAVSPVSACAVVRGEMVRMQREIASAHPRLVTEGRDQGSVVFPNAPLHIYLEANPRVRAQRRVAQLCAAGHTADEASILRAILHRDHVDSTRTVGPLRIPVGAVCVDTSALDLEAVVNTLEDLARKRLGAQLVIASSESVRP